MRDRLSIKKVYSLTSSPSQNSQKDDVVLMTRPPLKQWPELIEWVRLVFLILAIYVLVNLVSVRFIVQGPSMEKTFHGDDYLIVSRVSYLIGPPKRGDVIVFHYPPDPDQDYIKRVIGQPGDQIQIKDTHLYVNGELIAEPYIHEDCSPMSCRDNSWELGDDEYFVMGDNRNHSSDSRSFQVPVERKHIIGKVVFRYWPIDVAGFIRNGYESSE